MHSLKSNSHYRAKIEFPDSVVDIIERLSFTLRGRTSNGKNETLAVCF